MLLGPHTSEGCITMIHASASALLRLEVLRLNTCMQFWFKASGLTLLLERFLQVKTNHNRAMYSSSCTELPHVVILELDCITRFLSAPRHQGNHPLTSPDGALC